MRNDLLVSIGVIDEGDPLTMLDRIEAMIATLAERFRYYEVLLVVDEGLRGSLDSAAQRLSRLTNLRIVLMGDGAGYYQRRLIAASEAIGDVVAVVHPDDFSIERICDLLEMAKDRNEIVIGWGAPSRLIGLPYLLLAELSRHKVSPSALRTIVLPREKLNRILARDSAVLDLRFEPKDRHINYLRVPCDPAARRSGSVNQRFELLSEILMTGAPRYLKIYAAMAMGVAIAAMVFAAYAVVIIAIRDHVQPGWFSTSMVQSGAVFFIAVGMAVLSMAFAGLLERQAGREWNAISDEISNIDFFNRQKDLNVEVASSVEPA